MKMPPKEWFIRKIAEEPDVDPTTGAPMSEICGHLSDSDLSKVVQFSDTFKVVRIEEPYDSAEQYLLDKIAELQREYHVKAKPLIDEFVARRNSRAGKYWIGPGLSGDG